MKKSTSILTKALIFTFLLSAGINLGTPTRSEALGWKIWTGCALTGPIGLSACGIAEAVGSGSNDETITIDGRSNTNSYAQSQTHQYNPAHVVVFQNTQCKNSKSIRSTSFYCSKVINFKNHNNLNRGLIKTSAPGYVFFQENQCKFKRSWKINKVTCKKVLLRKKLSKKMPLPSNLLIQPKRR